MDVSLAFIALGPDMVPCAKAGMASESASAPAASVIRSMMVSRGEVGRMLLGRENSARTALLPNGRPRQKVSHCLAPSDVAKGQSIALGTSHERQKTA